MGTTRWRNAGLSLIPDDPRFRGDANNRRAQTKPAYRRGARDILADLTDYVVVTTGQR